MLDLKKSLIKTGDSTFDAIHASFINDKIELSTLQEEIKNRWISIWTLQIERNSIEEAINIHRKVNENLSRAQAFRDLKNANKLFGNLFKISRDGKRAIYSEYVHNFYKRAIEKNDLKAEGKALELLGKAWQVDVMDDQKFNPEKFDNPQIKMKFPKKLVEVVVKHLDKNPIMDFNKTIVEDITHEEVE